MTNSHGLVIIAEPRPRWTLLLRRFAASLRITQATTLDLSEDHFRTQQPVFLCVDAMLLDRQEKLVRLTLLLADFPTTRCAICMTASLPVANAPLQAIPDDLYYAAGAQRIFRGIASLPACIRMARRYFRSQPMEQLSWREEIAARLPWQPVFVDSHKQ